jgi:hypothetical protein
VNGWLIVGVAVAAYDGLAMRRRRETMSTVYRRTYRSHPLIIGASTAYMVGHLTGHLPQRYDALRRIGA